MLSRGWFPKPVLGHVLKYMPKHVPEYVLKHVPKHVLRHKPDQHVSRHLLKQMTHAVLIYSSDDLAAAHYRLAQAVLKT